MPVLYSIALLIVFYALLVAEILIPSGGLLGLAALVVAVTSVIIGFTSSFSWGLTLTLVFLVTTPILFAILIQVWPRTKIGRVMLNRDTLESDRTPPALTTLDGTPLTELVGRIGIAATDLLPGGQIKIDGHKSDAVSTGLPIDAQTKVIVVRVYSGKLQVRAANPQEIDNYHRQGDTSPETRDQSLATEEPTDRVPAAPGASLLDDIDFDEIDIQELPPSSS